MSDEILKNILSELILINKKIDKLSNVNESESNEIDENYEYSL